MDKLLIRLGHMFLMFMLSRAESLERRLCSWETRLRLKMQPRVVVDGRTLVEIAREDGVDLTAELPQVFGSSNPLFKELPVKPAPPGPYVYEPEPRDPEFDHIWNEIASLETEEDTPEGMNGEVTRERNS